MQPSNNLDIAHFNDIAYMSDGSNSNIYTAFLNGVRVVIKMLKKEVAQDQVALLEYDAEAALLSRVSHPNIIKLLGKGTAPRRFLVLEYLAGGSLSSKQNIVHSSHGSTKPILRKPTYTYEELLLLIRDIATALNHLHTRHAATGAVIIHRDIKPDNIGFTEKGEVKLFDFGLSTVVRKTRTTQEAYEMTGNTGSLRYMAPEVVLNRAYNEKVDVYSFGIMVWQIATDRIPFKGMSKDQFVRDIVLNKQRPKLDPSWPPGFKALLEGCWHDDYQKRPSSSFILDDINILLRNLKAQKPSVKIQSMFGDFII
jgi:serine/threonine protein kinase